MHEFMISGCRLLAVTEKLPPACKETSRLLFEKLKMQGYPLTAGASLQHCHESAHAWNLLDRLLQSQNPISGSAIRPADIVRNPEGKPCIRHEPLLFSLSHCKYSCVCLLARPQSGLSGCGIDIEPVRQWPLRLARRICTPQEYHIWLQHHRDPDWITRLFTCKEAWAKACGISLMDVLQCEAKQMDVYSWKEENCWISAAVWQKAR